MKYSKLLFIIPFATILFSCGGTSLETSSNDITSSSDTYSFTSSTSSNTSETTSDNTNELYDIIDGSFVYDGSETIKSLSYNNLLIFKDKIKTGTFSFLLKTENSFSSNGLVINYQDDKNYDYVSIDVSGNLAIGEYKDGVYTSLNTKEINAGSSSELSCYINFEYSTIHAYYNDSFELNYTFSHSLSSNMIGFKSTTKNTSFSSWAFKENEEFLSNSYSNYYVANGAWKDNETSLESTALNSIFVNNAFQNFSQGTFSCNINLTSVKKDNGLIFCLNDNEKTSFWEADVSYYFFFISFQNNAFLGKVNNGVWSNCTFHHMDNFTYEGSHSLRVDLVYDKINCFIDGNLEISYIDSDRLTGEKIGLRTGAKDVKFTNIEVCETTQSELSSNYASLLGNSYKFGSTIINKENGIYINKDNKAKNGTLLTRYAPVSSSGSGIVFRLSCADNLIANNENELSYYYLNVSSSGFIGFTRYEKGISTNLTYKYLCAGSSLLTGYNVKIIMNADTIYCYYNDRLSFKYVDENPLSGEYYGFKSSGKGTVIQDIELSSDNQIEKYTNLIFGHSYTQFWYTYKEDFSYFDDIYDIGIGGSIASHWCDYVNEIISYEPTYGIYNIGINDLTGNIAPKNIVASIESLLTNIKNALPNFRCCLYNISRCTARTYINSTIASANVLYKEMSVKYDWIDLVDVEYLFCDSSKNPISSYFVDGLHPTHQGYLLMAEALKKVINL